MCTPGIARLPFKSVRPNLGITRIGLNNFAGAFHPACCLYTLRTFYFPRKNWFPWRARLARQRQENTRLKRHIWPRYLDPDEAPIFGDKREGVLAFREEEVRIGLKSLTHYGKLLKNRQLTDAIDWIESLTQLKTAPILKLLKQARDECKEQYGMDIARVYIFDAQGARGFFAKTIRKHSRGNYGVNKSPRNLFMIRVRELPLEEYFHRLYIVGKVPRSLSADMRLAIYDKKVSRQMLKEWAPYICAQSKWGHRRQLKWLDGTRQFDYYKVRQEWINNYRANLLRQTTEAREARGLPPLLD